MNLPSLPGNLTLRQLRAFVTVADCGGFAAAALQLHLTPSALSLLIKEIESGLNVRLFDRTTRKTALSSAGTAFYPLARKVLEDLARAVQSTQDLEQKKRGTVRVACTPLYASTLLPELIQRYRQQYPAIAVFVLDSLNQTALARVASGEADFGIAPQRPAPPELLEDALYRDRMVLVCPRDHAFARLSRITWTQALREPIVSLTQDFTSRLQADLYKHSATLTLEPAHSVSFITTALGMVQSGHGITVQPAFCTPLLPPFGLVARPLVEPAVYRRLSLFQLRGVELSPAAHSLAGFIRQALKERGRKLSGRVRQAPSQAT